MNIELKVGLFGESNVGKTIIKYYIIKLLQLV